MSLLAISVSPSSGGSRVSSFTASDPTHQRLLTIFQKIQTGMTLSSDEMSFLTATSKFSPSTGEWLGSFVRTPTDDASVKEIDALSQRVLRREITSTATLDQVEQTLVAKDSLTKKETAALARLIQSCLTRGGSFAEVLDGFKRVQGRDPKRGELIDLVNQFNREALPKPTQAGAVACRTTVFDIPEENPIYDPHSVLEIRYDQSGFLEIIEGPVAPMDLSSRQTLTTAQRQEMHQLYHSLADSAYYNNLGEFLEFMSHCRRERETNPDLSLREAYASYHPDLGQVFDKYQSGTCILLATKFSQEASKRGVEMQCVGKQTLNDWTGIPIPGSEMKWNDLTKETYGADHTDVVCIYDDGARPDAVMEFQCSFEGKEDVREWRSVDRYFQLGRGCNIDSQYLPNKILDCGTIGKARLQGRFDLIPKN